MTNWHIREAKTKDADGLQRCMHSAYSVYSERMGDESLPPLEIDYADEIVNYPAWVAESDGNIVGGGLSCVLIMMAQHFLTSQ